VGHTCGKLRREREERAGMVEGQLAATHQKKKKRRDKHVATHSKYIRRCFPHFSNSSSEREKERREEKREEEKKGREEKRREKRKEKKRKEREKRKKEERKKK
jgi:hypothetical protein